MDDVKWRKSSRSLGHGECIEIAPLPEGGALVRNSNDPDGPVLSYTRAEMAAFIQGAKDGEFDDLADDSERS